MYWAPGAETGRKPRTVSTLRKGPLHIGHPLSVEDGVAVGADNTLLYDDANLAAMCETCNLGLRPSVGPRTYAAIMRDCSVPRRALPSDPDRVVVVAGEATRGPMRQAARERLICWADPR